MELGEKQAKEEQPQPLTSEVASGGGLPQKRLLRAMPADSMLPVSAWGGGNVNVIFGEEDRGAGGAAPSSCHGLI